MVLLHTTVAQAAVVQAVKVLTLLDQQTMEPMVVQDYSFLL
jgi:hypothetical protein